MLIQNFLDLFTDPDISQVLESHKRTKIMSNLLFYVWNRHDCVETKNVIGLYLGQKFQNMKRNCLVNSKLFTINTTHEQIF